MKIDRLLSIIVYLLNRDLVSARDLAEKFGVSSRTIQRDLEAIDSAGIPVMAVQGPKGGYGIVDSYRMDRQLMSADDLFYIITSLKGVGSSLPSRRIESTTEKMQNLLSRGDARAFDERHRRLYVDFSLLGGGKRHHEVFRIVEEAVDQGRLLKIQYTNTKLESSERTVEPMTIAFRWRSWYLFAFCRLKQDYRLFRLSRISNPQALAQRFRRREKTIGEYLEETGTWISENPISLVLAFHPSMRPLVEEYFEDAQMEEGERGRFIVRATMPEDGWVYGMILSYGNLVEVLSPQRARTAVRDLAAAVQRLYEKKPDSPA